MLLMLSRPLLTFAGLALTCHACSDTMTDDFPHIGGHVCASVLVRTKLWVVRWRHCVLAVQYVKYVTIDPASQENKCR